MLTAVKTECASTVFPLKPLQKGNHHVACLMSWWHLYFRSKELHFSGNLWYYFLFHNQKMGVSVPGEAAVQFCSLLLHHL